MEADLRGLLGYLVKFQIPDMLNLTVRELDILVTLEELLTLDLQIRLKSLLSVPGILVFPETFTADSLNAYTIVSMTTDTLHLHLLPDFDDELQTFRSYWATYQLLRRQDQAGAGSKLKRGTAFKFSDVTCVALVLVAPSNDLQSSWNTFMCLVLISSLGIVVGIVMLTLRNDNYRVHDEFCSVEKAPKGILTISTVFMSPVAVTLSWAALPDEFNMSETITGVLYHRLHHPQLQRARGLFALRCRVVVEVSLTIVHTILVETV